MLRAANRAKSKPLLSHYRRTKRRAWCVLGAAILGAVGVIGLEVACFPDWREDFPLLFLVSNGLGLLAGGIAVFVYAVLNLLMDREFRFALYEDHVECRCPTRPFGHSYSIALDEIIGLEEEVGLLDRNDWYLVTRDGQKTKITYNYGNPVDRIVATLRQMRPELPVKRV